ncbi:MAG TPA: cytochrome c oxidase subunit II [Vicinamibacterales bacterium]|nr:cytochrome c oxidase subunit II [Vicinamibacterales bacterium]
MFNNFFPAAASTHAGDVDTLYFFLVAVSAFFTILIASLVAFFAIRYRRRHAGEVGAGITGSHSLELLWTIIPLGITMVMFFWGAGVYFNMFRAPRGAMEIQIVGKQWMWKVQHPDGRREINELHIPVGRPVKLVMGSEDVIHSFFIPAFRTKMDVVPGKTTNVWFQATKAGRFHLFCTEYCGLNHSGMIGSIVAMEPEDFQAWLAGGTGADASPAQAGEKLFADLACNTCHTGDAQARGPVLNGLFGRTVQLQDGSTVVADETYIRESILNPQAKIAAGFQPLMPTFQGMVTEEQILQLIAYIRSLAGAPGAPAGQAAGTPPSVTR